MSDFVIRPGRSIVAWSKESSRGARFKVTSDLAVSLICEGQSGPVGASSGKKDHELVVSVDKAQPLTLKIQNASGTRKARGTIEVSRG